METPSQDTSRPPERETPSFEEAMSQLEAIVHQLEEGQIGLAESLDCYERGVRLLKQCYQLLEATERRIELLAGVDAQGNPILKEFDDEATLQRQTRGSGNRRRPARKPPPDQSPPQSDEPSFG
jgi:exodeoxyribonuclease VII small subunit